MKPYGTRIESWYPLGHGDINLLNEAIFLDLAQKYGKSPAQIILRWHIQMGNLVFPKSTSQAHLQENIDIFNFELSNQEMAEIATLDKGKRYYDTSIEERAKLYRTIIPRD
ncbi:putative oxidoreductase [Streptococcus sp. BCA20]|nr:putative oxidoreductase [Streptococcus sp. BCA20]